MAILRKGSRLILKLDVTRPDAWQLPSAVSVTPADVARLVLQALSDGWQPEVDGNSVVRKVTPGQSDAAAASGPSS